MTLRRIGCPLKFLIFGVLIVATLLTLTRAGATSPTLYDVAGQGIPNLDAMTKAISGQRWFAQGASNYCVGYAALNGLRKSGRAISPDNLEREYEARWPDETWMQVSHILVLLYPRGIELASMNFALKDGHWRNMSYDGWERQTSAYVASHVPIDVYPWLTDYSMYHAVTVIAVRAGIVRYIDPRDGREYEALSGVFWRTVLGPKSDDGGYLNKWQVRRSVKH